MTKQFRKTISSLDRDDLTWHHERHFFIKQRATWTVLLAVLIFALTITACGSKNNDPTATSNPKSAEQAQTAFAKVTPTFQPTPTFTPEPDVTRTVR